MCPSCTLYLLYFPIQFIVETLLQKYWKWGFKNEFKEINIKDKIVVITGANSGLGKFTAKEMAKRGAVVVMGCRDLEKGEKAREEIIKATGSASVNLHHLDISDLSSVRDFASKVIKAHPVIDIIINNAGISLNSDEKFVTRQGWELTMVTNHLGPFLLTKLLINSVLSSEIAGIVNVSSSLCVPSTLDPSDLMMEKDENMGFFGTKPYQNSKLANALFTKTLAKKYPSIKTCSLCPGFVKTEIHRNCKGVMWLMMKLTLYLFAVKVEEGFDTILFCCLGEQVRLKDSGGFFRFRKHVKGVEQMLQDELAENVWRASEELVDKSYISK